MMATYGLAATTLGFVAADIGEGVGDINKSQSGDLSQSHNAIRDTVFEAMFGENKQVAYDFTKAINDIAFGIVSGKAIGSGFKVLAEAQKVQKIACGSQTLKNLKTVVQVGGNVTQGILNDLAYTGKVDVGNLLFNMGLGFVQGQVGSRVTDGILSKVGIDDMSLVAQKVTQVTVGTAVDTTMDWIMSALTGQEFDLKESLVMNAFANGLAESISDPVDAVTGAYLLHETDFILASLPEAIKLERTYLSTRKSVSVLGKGWHFVYDSHIYVNTKKTKQVHLKTITGHSLCFEKQEELWVSQTKGTSRFLLEEQNHRFVLKDIVAHTHCHYDETGRLSVVEYPNHQRLCLFYDEEGLAKIVTPLGNVLEVVSKNGKIHQITDEIGRRTQYRYEGDLLTDIIHTDEGITHYEYDENDSIIAVTDQNGVRYLENEYDKTGRITKQIFENGVYQTFLYDDKNRRNTILYSETGKTELYEYNKELLPEKIVYEDGTCTIYEYSQDNLRTRETSRTGAVTQWVYDSYGRLIQEIDPEGFQSYYEYNENHDLVRVWDKERETITKYDENHNKLLVQEKISETEWKETLFQYDEKGRKISEQDGVGNITTYKYEPNRAYPSSVITPKGETTVYEYDKVGRRMSINNSYGTVELSYNSRNFVTKRVDGEGYVSYWFYDRRGKLTIGANLRVNISK